MSTLFLPFQPSLNVAPTFLLMLADQHFSLTVRWNVSAQRYYINLYDQNGVWVATVPLIETPANQSISRWSYDPLQRVMQYTLEEPFWRPPGEMVDVVFEGVEPATLNGPRRVEVVDNSNRTFLLATDPGQVTHLGTVNYYFNLVDGYVRGGSLIFRNNQFEAF